MLQEVQFEWPLAYIKRQGRSLLTLISVEGLEISTITT